MIKQTRGAIKFLLAEYRAVLKNAMLAMAVATMTMVSSGIASAYEFGDWTNEGSLEIDNDEFDFIYGTFTNNGSVNITNGSMSIGEVNAAEFINNIETSSLSISEESTVTVSGGSFIVNKGKVENAGVIQLHDDSTITNNGTITGITNSDDSVSFGSLYILNSSGSRVGVTLDSSADAKDPSAEFNLVENQGAFTIKSLLKTKELTLGEGSSTTIDDNGSLLFNTLDNFSTAWWRGLYVNSGTFGFNENGTETLDLTKFGTVSLGKSDSADTATLQASNIKLGGFNAYGNVKFDTGEKTGTVTLTQNAIISNASLTATGELAVEGADINLHETSFTADSLSIDEQNSSFGRIHARAGSSIVVNDKTTIKRGTLEIDGSATGALSTASLLGEVEVADSLFARPYGIIRIGGEAISSEDLSSLPNFSIEKNGKLTVHNGGFVKVDGAALLSGTLNVGTQENDTNQNADASYFITSGDVNINGGTVNVSTNGYFASLASMTKSVEIADQRSLSLTNGGSLNTVGDVLVNGTLNVGSSDDTSATASSFTSDGTLTTESGANINIDNSATLTAKAFDFDNSTGIQVKSGTLEVSDTNGSLDLKNLASGMLVLGEDTATAPAILKASDIYLGYFNASGNVEFDTGTSGKVTLTQNEIISNASLTATGKFAASDESDITFGSKSSLDAGSISIGSANEERRTRFNVYEGASVVSKGDVNLFGALDISDKSDTGTYSSFTSNGIFNAEAGSYSYISYGASLVANALNAKDTAFIAVWGGTLDVTGSNGVDLSKLTFASGGGVNLYGLTNYSATLKASNITLGDFYSGGKVLLDAPQVTLTKEHDLKDTNLKVTGNLALNSTLNLKDSSSLVVEKNVDVTGELNSTEANIPVNIGTVTEDSSSNAILNIGSENILNIHNGGAVSLSRTDGTNVIDASANIAGTLTVGKATDDNTTSASKFSLAKGTVAVNGGTVNVNENGRFVVGENAEGDNSATSHVGVGEDSSLVLSNGGSLNAAGDVLVNGILNVGTSDNTDTEKSSFTTAGTLTAGLGAVISIDNGSTLKAGSLTAGSDSIISIDNGSTIKAKALSVADDIFYLAVKSGTLQIDSANSAESSVLDLSSLGYNNLLLGQDTTDNLATLKASNIILGTFSAEGKVKLDADKVTLKKWVIIENASLEATKKLNLDTTSLLELSDSSSVIVGGETEINGQVETNGSATASFLDDLDVTGTLNLLGKSHVAIGKNISADTSTSEGPVLDVAAGKKLNIHNNGAVSLGVDEDSVSTGYSTVNVAGELTIGNQDGDSNTGPSLFIGLGELNVAGGKVNVDKQAQLFVGYSNYTGSINSSRSSLFGIGNGSTLNISDGGSVKSAENIAICGEVNVKDNASLSADAGIMLADELDATSSQSSLKISNGSEVTTSGIVFSGTKESLADTTTQAKVTVDGGTLKITGEGTGANNGSDMVAVVATALDDSVYTHDGTSGGEGLIALKNSAKVVIFHKDAINYSNKTISYAYDSGDQDNSVTLSGVNAIFNADANTTVSISDLTEVDTRTEFEALKTKLLGSSKGTLAVKYKDVEDDGTHDLDYQNTVDKEIVDDAKQSISLNERKVKNINVAITGTNTWGNAELASGEDVLNINTYTDAGNTQKSSLALHKAADDGLFVAKVDAEGNRSAGSVNLNDSNSLKLQAKGSLADVSGGTGSELVTEGSADVDAKSVNVGSLKVEKGTSLTVAENVSLTSPSADTDATAKTSAEINGNLTVKGNLETEDLIVHGGTVEVGTLDDNYIRVKGKMEATDVALISTKALEVKKSSTLVNSTVSADSIALSGDTSLSKSSSLSGAKTLTADAALSLSDSTAQADTVTLNGITSLQDNSKLIVADVLKLGNTLKVDPSYVFAGNGIEFTSPGAVLAVLKDSVVVNGSGTSETTGTGANLYLNKNIDLSNGGKIYLNGNQTNSEFNEASVIAQVTLGENSKLIVNQSAIDSAEADNKAVVQLANDGTIAVSDGASVDVNLDKAKAQTVKLFNKAVDADGKTKLNTSGVGLNLNNVLFTATVDTDAGNTVIDVKVKDDTSSVLDGLDSDVKDTIISQAKGDGFDTTQDNGLGYVSKALQGTSADAVRAIGSLTNYAFASYAPQVALLADDAGFTAVSQRAGFNTQSASTLGAVNGDTASVWVTPLYRKQSSDSFDIGGLEYGAKTNLYGLALGADFALPLNLRAGVSLHVGNGKAKSEGNFNYTQNEFDFFGGELYGFYQGDNLSVLADVGYTHVSNDVEQGSLKSDFDSKVFSAGIKAKYVFNTGLFDIAPHAGVRYSHAKVDGFKVKSDNGTLLNADNMSGNIVKVPVGVTISNTFKDGDWSVKPLADISVITAFGDKDWTFTSHITGMTANNGRVSVDADVVDTVSVAGTLGIEAQMGNRLSVGAGYTFTKSENIREHALTTSFRYAF